MVFHIYLFFNLKKGCQEFLNNLLFNHKINFYSFNCVGAKMESPFGAFELVLISS